LNRCILFVSGVFEVGKFLQFSFYIGSLKTKM